jgi:hypothetical protein
VADFCRARKIETLVKAGVARFAREVRWRAASLDHRSGRPLFTVIMNNSELNRILKAAKVPERPKEFWTQFPRRVTARLHWKSTAADARASNWFPRLAWSLAAVGVCLAIGFLAGHRTSRNDAVAENGLLQNAKVIEEMLAMFPNRVRAVVQDEHGLNLVLSEKDDVPASAPLWVKVCDGKNCSAIVTFSGQDIKVGGQAVTVLADAQGKIILAGDNFLWSNGEPLVAGNHLKIEARTLGSAVL